MSSAFFLLYLAAAFDSVGCAGDLFVSGDYAYVIYKHIDSGLKIIDISDRSLPFRVESYDISGYLKGVFVSQNIIYVANGWADESLCILESNH